MPPLQERAKTFLNRPLPPELAERHVSGSITDLLLAGYITDGTLDAKNQELIGICAVEADLAADRFQTQEAREYFRECAAILQAIGTELAAA